MRTACLVFEIQFFYVGPSLHWDTPSNEVKALFKYFVDMFACMLLCGVLFDENLNVVIAMHVLDFTNFT